MKQVYLPILLLSAAGCTTTPQAGFMDRVFPSRNACAGCQTVVAAEPLSSAPVSSTAQADPGPDSTVVAQPIHSPASGIVADEPQLKRRRLLGQHASRGLFRRRPVVVQ
jgi:hypothetical protein